MQSQILSGKTQEAKEEIRISRPRVEAGVFFCLSAFVDFHFFGFIIKPTMTDNIA